MSLELSCTDDRPVSRLPWKVLPSILCCPATWHEIARAGFPRAWERMRRRSALAPGGTAIISCWTEKRLRSRWSWRLMPESFSPAPTPKRGARCVGLSCPSTIRACAPSLCRYELEMHPARLVVPERSAGAGGESGRRAEWRLRIGDADLYTQDLPIEQRLRNVCGQLIADGTPQIQKINIARHLYGRQFV